MITARYFTAKLSDAEGVPIPPPGRFITLQAALLFAEEQDGKVEGTLYYVEDEASPPVPMIRYIDGEPEEVPQ